MSHDSSRAPQHGAPPSPFHAYREGRLESGGVSLADVADKFDTPTYVYAPASIDARYRAIDDALSFAPHLIAYAVKANASPFLLGALYGAGVRHFDVASLPEIEDVASISSPIFTVSTPSSPRSSAHAMAASLLPPTSTMTSVSPIWTTVPFTREPVA